MAEPAPLGRPALKIAPPPPRIAYHVDDGAFEFPYVVDARMAVGQHPDEWSWHPWTPERAEQAHLRLAEKHARIQEAARKLGLPEPQAPKRPEPMALTDEEQAALDDFRAAQAAAKERIRLRAEADARQRAADEQAEADEALLKQQPPLPDPKDPRRLFGAAKANAEAKVKRLADDAAARATEAAKAAQGAKEST
jgi:hypothetical protein